MLFPNLNQHLGLRCDSEPIMERAFGFTSIWPVVDPADPQHLTTGMIEACTASDQEIEDRTADGEFSFDVIDEHMTSIFFQDRASFKHGWRLARLICNRNAKIVGAASGVITDIREIEGCATHGLSILASSHHTGQAA